MTIFSDWLTSQLVNRKMSPADLARRMRKDQGVISRLLSGERKPANSTLDAIANAFDLPQETVYQAAGVLFIKKDHDPWVEEQIRKLDRIPPGLRKKAEAIIAAFAESENADEIQNARDIKTSPIK